MNESYSMVPATGAAVWITVGLLVLMVGLTALFASMLYSARHTGFEISRDALRITGTIYARRVPVASLLLDDAKVVDLGKDESYRMKWRTNGIGLPGYRAGWFKLRNGEKALAFVTDTKRIAYIPTTGGFSVLLSVRRPEELLQSLRRSAGT
jgi:hypothetical protein